MVLFRMARDRGLIRPLHIPKSMPMTCPLTFSSPPVEAYRANTDEVGVRIVENLEMVDDRGTCEESGSTLRYISLDRDIQHETSAMQSYLLTSSECFSPLKRD